MGDKYHHDYVPPSKRPKPPTPPPEPKETNPWLISQATNPDEATASTEPVQAQAPGNNPWLVSEPTPSSEMEPEEPAAGGDGSLPPAPPPSPQSFPAFLYAAFPVRIWPSLFHFAIQVVSKQSTDTRNFRLSQSTTLNLSLMASSTSQEHQSPSQASNLSGSRTPLDMLRLLLRSK